VVGGGYAALIPSRRYSSFMTGLQMQSRLEMTFGEPWSFQTGGGIGWQLQQRDSGYRLNEVGCLPTDQPLP